MERALRRSIDEHRTRVDRGDGGLIDERMVVDAEPAPDGVSSSRERLVRLGQCISRLSETTRAIVIAHRVDGMTYEEIGRLYGLSISGVERQIAKALLQISTWMTGGDS